jgi:hypothetical protein
MALLMVDSFDYYTSVAAIWPLNTSGNGSLGAYGRFSTNGLRMPGSRWCQMRSLPSNMSTVYAGVAAKYSEDNVEMAPLLFWDTVNNVQVMIVIAYSGNIKVYRGWGDALLATSTALVPTPLKIWHYYEAKVVFSQTVGQVIVRVDGIEFINTSANLDTCKSSNVYANIVGLNHSYTNNQGMSCDYDDFYLDDSQFHGDCQVIFRAPTGAGNYTQFDPSAGNNWDCVEENPPSTSEYVSNSVLNEIDTYAIADISPSSGTVKAVIGNFYCQRDSIRHIGMVTRLSATDLVSAGQGVPASWGYLQFIQETKPGGGAWSVQDTKDAEMGMKLVV